MRSLRRLTTKSSVLFIATVAVLALPACNSRAPKALPPPTAPHSSNKPSGHMAWPSWAEDNPLPGVDHTAAYVCWDDRVIFVIWTDFDTSAGGTSGPTLDGVCSVFLIAESGTQVECECKTKDGVSGTLSIHVDKQLVSDVPYDLGKGRMFLISTQRGVPEVTQLRRDAVEVAVEGSAAEYVKARLQELAVNDFEIKHFLTKATSGGDSDGVRP